MKFIFYCYQLISRFYGIHYDRDKNYSFKSNDIELDINKLFYVNHEDIYTADQIK